MSSGLGPALTLSTAQIGALGEAALQAEILPLQALYDPALQARLSAEVLHRAGAAAEDLLARLREALAGPSGVALVRGLPWDPEHRLLVALHAAFGQLVSQPYNPPRAQLVHHVAELTDLRRRGHAQSEVLHSDGVDWVSPPELLALVCARPDPAGGGRTLLVERAEIEALVASRSPDDLRALAETPIPFQLADWLGGGQHWAPILGPRALRWRRYTIDDALAHGAPLDPEVCALLDRFEALLAEVPCTEELLQQGDLVLSDNLRTLHARTAILGPPEVRLMYRIWVRQHEQDEQSRAGVRLI